MSNRYLTFSVKQVFKLPVEALSEAEQVAFAIQYYVGCEELKDSKAAWQILIALVSIYKENTKISTFNFLLKIWSENHRTTMIVPKKFSFL